MRFSIIIPVYNVEKYIAKCMESLVNQSFRDYELIIVDDESPDGSMSIVETYQKKYPEKIRIIHQKNTRQGGARNHGVTLALGEYLIFVDSDDYVSTSMLEILDRRLKENPCDILVFDSVSVTERGELLPQEPMVLKPGTYVPAECPPVVQLPGAPWGKAFRRELYMKTGFQFPPKVLYEDVTTRILYAQARRIVICSDTLYYYVQRENSSMSQKISEKMLDILTVTEMVRKEFIRLNLYDTFREPLQTALIYCILNIVEMISCEQWNHPMLLPLADYLQETFPDYENNSLASPELKRVLRCLTAHKFRYYHWRFLGFNRLKERILQSPLARNLNELRK